MQLPINVTQDWLEARVQASPTQIAIQAIGSQGDRILTYHQLATEVDSLTPHLIYAGIEQQRKVGLLLNSIPYLTLIPALIRIGAIIIPLNTRLTSDEILWQVKSSECDFVITDIERKAIAQTIVQSGVKVYLLTGNRPDLDLPSLSPIEPIDIEPALPRDVNLEDPFAIIHTSGTSGKPKGAVLTYNNIYQSAMTSAYRIGVMPDDRWLCVLPLFHVGGLSILLRSLLYGTMVDLFPYFDVREINLKLTNEPITVVSLVPTMLQRLLDAREQAWNPKLRLVLLGGAAPSPELVQRCIDEKIPIATTYGMTEASSQVATSTPELVVQKPASVGKPLMFTQVRVIDGQGQDMPTNEIGEIIVKSPTVMQGYYNNPDATTNTIKEGWIYTGDMGYKDEDGDLFVVQRRSDLIVTGGENVYPAEVENALRQHPQIKEIVVIGLDDTEWGQRVAAAIQLEDGQDLLPDEIITFARQHIAGYKIPREIQFVQEFPQTGSGKIQRQWVRKVFEGGTLDD